MSLIRRMLIVLIVTLLTTSGTAAVLAQTDGPDPDGPIKLQTAEADDDGPDPNDPIAPPDRDDEDEPADDESPAPGEGDDDTTAPGEGDEDTDTAPSDDDALDPADDDDATEPSDDDDLAPDASPAASPAGEEGVDIAAITLDSTSLPEGWFLISEGFTSGEQLADDLDGLIDGDELLATGIQTYYSSTYLNAEGNTVRSYVIAFETAEGAADGFAMLEDEEAIVPNGDFEDLPVPIDLGDGPSELSLGDYQNGDGSITTSLDFSFTIDRFEIGAAMETFDGSDPDQDLVEEMAQAVADRAEAVLAGEPLEGIDDSLPGSLITLDDANFTLEGYQTALEAFLIADPDIMPAGYVSGYFRAGSFGGPTSRLPFVSVGLSTFESPVDVEDAMANTDSIMPLYDELEEIDGVEVADADAVLAFSFASPEGEGDPDSARIFVQVDDQLIVVDVQGAGTANDAEATALELAELQVACVLEGSCGPAEIDL
ncbi:MAG: hypothetical protein M3Y37_00610 [Chloroflexota bacterium]|nr:hypothetical protein [Chloroflexota bacterium]